MKTKILSLKIAAAVVAVSSLGLSAQAQTTFIKANNTSNLNNSTSYTANSGTPGINDTISINSTVTSNITVSLGGNMSVKGVQITDPTPSPGIFTIATGNTLTLGNGGINMSAASQNLVVNANLALSDNQSWQVNTRSLQIGNNSALSQNGFLANVSGNGTFDWRSTTATTFDGLISITTLRVNAVAAVFTLGNNSNSFSALFVDAGKVRASTIGNFGSTSAVGTGGISSNITLGGNSQNGTFEYTGNTSSTNRTFSRDARSATSGINVSTAGQTLTISGNMGSGSQNGTLTNGWVFGGAGNLTLSGNITNSTGASTTGTTLTKNDGGTLTLSGSSKAYTGATTVTAGTLLISGGGLTATSGLSVSGGALELGAANVLNNTATLTLSGGTFKTGGFAETLGTLTLTNSTASFLDFGSGTSVLLFAGITSGNGTLAISNWTSGVDSLRFTSNSTLLASSFTVNGGAATILNQGSYYEIVPEPSTWALLAFSLTAVVILRRRVRA